jgi:hypothetical protein
MSATVHYANPDESTFTGACFEFHFGAYGATIVRVFQRADHVEDALETAAEYLDSIEPGHFCDQDQLDELMAETCGELGLTWPVPEGTDDLEPYWEAEQEAYADLTYTESGYLTAYEWSVNEVEETDVLPEPHFDRFDICEAHALFAYFGDVCAEFEALSDNAKAIYRDLVTSY